MDHHCPWLNNCVGRRNRAYFLSFLLHILLSLIYSQSVWAFAFTHRRFTSQLLDDVQLLTAIFRFNSHSFWSFASHLSSADSQDGAGTSYYQDKLQSLTDPRAKFTRTTPSLMCSGPGAKPRNWSALSSLMSNDAFHIFYKNRINSHFHSRIKSRLIVEINDFG
jgi:hypothetical protein